MRICCHIHLCVHWVQRIEPPQSCLLCQQPTQTQAHYALAHKPRSAYVAHAHSQAQYACMVCTHIHRPPVLPWNLATRCSRSDHPIWLQNEDTMPAALVAFSCTCDQLWYQHCGVDRQALTTRLQEQGTGQAAWGVAPCARGQPWRQGRSARPPTCSRALLLRIAACFSPHAYRASTVPMGLFVHDITPSTPHAWAQAFHTSRLGINLPHLMLKA